jgi:hypothetical protein
MKDEYMTKNEFYDYMIKIERRLSRLEIIFYINIIVTMVTLIKTLL